MKKLLLYLLAATVLTLGLGAIPARAAAPADAVKAPAVAAPAGTKPAVLAEEETFTVTLTDVGPNKVKVIKILRSVLDIELKEAYELVGKVPSVLKKDATAAQADDLKKQLEAEQAKVEVKKN